MTASATATPDTDFNPAYIIVSNGRRFPRGLERKVEAAGGTITGRLDQIGLVFVSATDAGFAERFDATGVDLVPDAFVDSVNPRETVADESAATFEGAAPVRPNAEGIGADEPYFDELYGLWAVDAPEAWAAGQTGEGVLVAVLDEGFDLTHPDLPMRADLAASFTCWTSIDGVAYLSDDPADCEPAQYVLNDPFSHGTHVSGTIAALDNGIGVIGVAPDAEILPVKVLSEVLGGGAISWIVQGIVYATDQGADVINMSLGGLRALGQGPGTNNTAATLNVYRRAVDYAVKNGVTVITSAGNDSRDGDGNGPVRVTPADFEGSLAISATGSEGRVFEYFGLDPVDFGFEPIDYLRPASYTNYGTSLVDFAAPGGDYTLAFDPVYGLPNTFYVYDMILSTGSLGSYYYSAGTSMASPHAAGVAAIIIGENGGSMKPAHVEREMRSRALDVGKPGQDDYYGHGAVRTGY